MKIIDNMNSLLGDDLSRIRICSTRRSDISGSTTEKARCSAANSTHKRPQKVENCIMK